MEMAKIVGMGREMLKVMSENDVRIDDWKHLQLYEEFCCMRGNGFKYRYVVEYLAKVYETSKASVERIVRRLRKDVK